MEKNVVAKPNSSKIPGGGMPIADREKYVKDLNKLTRVELLDIKAREAKLLSEKGWLKRLPDKGQRIQQFHDKVLAELDRRANVDAAAAMFSEMNIAAKGQTAMNRLEWAGNLKNGASTLADEDPSEDVLDSDDEAEIDPLKLIAQHTMHERQTRLLPPEPQLITAEDLAEIESFKAKESSESSHSTNSSPRKGANEPSSIETEVIEVAVTDKLINLKHNMEILRANKQPHNTCTESDDLDQHTRYLVEKTEQSANGQREKFKPYQTTVSNVHDPAKERLRKQNKYWEVTAATPPPIQHNGTKMLSLMDSVEIQSAYITKLKDLHERQAVERLAARNARLESRKLELPADHVLQTKPAFKTYRLPAVNYTEGKQSFSGDSDSDFLDEDDGGPNRGGITYTVHDY